MRSRTNDIPFFGIPNEVTDNGPVGKVLEVHKETDLYILSADLNTSGNTTADAMIRQMVEQSIVVFEQEYDSSKFKNESIAELQPSGNKWQADWKGAVMSRAGKYINYRIDAYEYTGGAHGNPAVIALVFDEDGRQVELSEVFANHPDYLTTLSRTSRALIASGTFANAELSAVAKENPEMFSNSYVLTGTEPKSENFVNFMLEHPGIRIIFGAYQIAPYAAGQPEIMIPWPDVKNIVNPHILERVHSE